MNQCKRLSDCPAERLAQCRGEAVQARCDALQGLLNTADQQISDLTHAASVPPAGDEFPQDFAPWPVQPVPSAGDVEVAAASQWREGAPPRPWDTEWFLAQLTDGSYAVLRQLPKDFTYDFATADETYLMRHRVNRWAQLSDSSYIAPKDEAVLPAGDVEVLRYDMSGFGDGMIEKADGAFVYLDDHSTIVTRLTVERDGLLGRLADTEECYRSAAQRADLYGEELKSTSDELTKAREFISMVRDIAFNDEAVIYSYAPGYIVDIRDAFRAFQPAKFIAHNVDESCGQDAEAAKGGA